MVSGISTILFLIFSSLSALHFYWLFGGKWGISKVIPTKNDEQASIPKIATFFVALFLFLIGVLYISQLKILEIHLPYWIERYGLLIIPGLFILRAIGEFKYVGFFKSITDTKFAQADSRFFSPLCLFIGVLGLIVYFGS